MRISIVFIILGLCLYAVEVERKGTRPRLGALQGPDCDSCMGWPGGGEAGAGEAGEAANSKVS